MSYKKPIKHSKVKYPLTSIEYFHGGDKEVITIQEVGRWNYPEIWDLIKDIHPDSVLLSRTVETVEASVPTHILHNPQE